MTKDICRYLGVCRKVSISEGEQSRAFEFWIATWCVPRGGRPRGSMAFGFTLMLTALRSGTGRRH